MNNAIFQTTNFSPLSSASNLSQATAFGATNLNNSPVWLERQVNQQQQQLINTSNIKLLQQTSKHSYDKLNQSIKGQQANQWAPPKSLPIPLPVGDINSSARVQRAISVIESQKLSESIIQPSDHHHRQQIHRKRRQQGNSLIDANNSYNGPETSPTTEEEEEAAEEEASASATTTAPPTPSSTIRKRQDKKRTLEATMITKSAEGYYVYNNITLKSCRDILIPTDIDRCTLTDYIEDCSNDEGLIDYVAFFFCAFSPERMPIALIVSILWLLTLFVATGLTATDFLCPALFMISKTLGLSQNIAGVTFLAFGNTSADIFAAINGIRLGKPDLVISVIYGSGTLITTAIVGCVFAIKDFRLDRLIFVRDIIFYCAAVSLLFYIFTVPGRIRLRDSVYLLALYFLYVVVVLASKYFTKDRPLKNLHGPDKKDPDEGGIEFEGVYIDDDPTASMVVMRKFLFYTEDSHYYQRNQTSRADRSNSNSANGNSGNLKVPTENGCLSPGNGNKSGRRVTLFEENIFTGVNSLSPDDCNRRRSRSASLISISKQQLGNLRRASRDMRRQSMDFLAAVSPIDLNVWKQQNWGGRTMELIKAPIRLFLLITTPMADVEGKHEWNKLLSTLHCITGPIFVVYAFGYGFEWVGPLTVPVWVFLISAPVSLIIIFTSTSETPPFYYNAYSSYLGFIVAITWIYTISSEVINLLRALGIAFNLTNEIMGLTILAWGNCMLDFITNVSIARKGLPKMAIAACFGGPLMSLLIGIGLPSFITLVIDPNHNTVLGNSPLLHIIYYFLIFGLLTTLIAVVLLKFRVRRSLGVYLIVLYLTLIVAEWLTEFQVLNFGYFL